MKLVSNNDVVQQRADCRACTRRNSVLCASLQEQDSEQSRQSVDLCSLLTGALLYRAGDQGRRFFTIRSGMVKLVQYLPDGTQRIVRLLGANDVAGLETLLGQPYQHDAVVVRATEACSLPVALVKAMSQTNAELYQELLTRWLQAVQDADAWLTEFSTGSAQKRIARLLLRLMGGDQSVACRLFSCEDMGAMLGVTTETVSRTIAEFKRKHVLVETKRNYVQLDTANLQRIA